MRLTTRAPSASRGKRELDECERREHVDLVDPPQLVERVLRQLRLWAGAEHARAVHEQVDRVAGRFDQPAAVIRIGDVARDRDDTVESADRTLERVPVARVHNEPPALLGESPRQREPETARRSGDDPLHEASSLGGHAVALDDPVVVEPEQRDHVADVFLVLDPARSVPRLAGKDGVIFDPALVEQVLPYVLGEPEVGNLVAVQVADLPAADLEGILAAATGPRLHSRPGR